MKLFVSFYGFLATFSYEMIMTVSFILKVRLRKTIFFLYLVFP